MIKILNSQFNHKSETSGPFLSGTEMLWKPEDPERADKYSFTGLKLHSFYKRKLIQLLKGSLGIKTCMGQYIVIDVSYRNM